MKIRLTAYRYKGGDPRARLGFIIEDVEPSPAADSAHGRVDLYGYISMAVAALQAQDREMQRLQAEVKALKRQINPPKGKEE